MNTERFHEQLGEIDLKYVSESAPRLKKNKRRWISAVAAVLVVAVVLGVFFGRGGKPESVTPVPGAVKSFAVSVPQYPESVPYPSSEVTGYDEWAKNRMERRQFDGAGSDLKDFFARANAAVLGDIRQNTVFSPLNTFMALAMLAEVTDGNSRAQILEALGVADVETLRDKTYRVWNANYSNDGAVTSILGNSVWLSDGVEYRQEILDTLARSYFASSFRGDFSDSRYQNAMRQWISEQTGGLLQQQAGNLDLSPETVLTLLSTLYFRAKWSDEFSKSDTADAVFHGESGDVSIPFMHRDDVYGAYYFGERFGAVRLYLREGGAMWFLLPDEGVTPDALFRDTEVQALMALTDDWVAQETYQNHKTLKIHLSLPRFDVSSQLDLKQAVASLGVTDVFDMSQADFTPLTESVPVAVAQIRNGARVAIDEEGVTAAAFTAIIGAGAAMPPEEEMDFVLDRPFAFVITGLDGLPLLTGTVWDID